MAYPVGEKLHCDDCGAEIVFVAPCDCPEREQKMHSNLCCGKEMRSLGIVSGTEKLGAPTSSAKKSAA